MRKCCKETASIKDAEHQQKIAEIFEEIETGIFNLCDPCACKVSKDWQALKSGLGGKEMIRCPGCGSRKYYYEGTYVVCSKCGREDRCKEKPDGHLEDLEDMGWRGKNGNTEVSNE